MIERSNLINKNIIYSDEINDKNSMIITTIPNINEYVTTDCAETILEENKDITFNHIKYSINNQIMYFFSNKKIKTNKWNEMINKEYKLVTFKDFFEEIKYILLSPDNNNKNEISAYEILKTIQKKHHEIEEYNKKTSTKLKNAFAKTNLEYIDFSFNYKENKLSIILKNQDIKIINVTKNNDKLQIDTNLENKEIIEKLINENQLEEIYETYLEFSQFKNQGSYNLTNENTNFLYNIDKYGLEIYTEICPFHHTKNFSILFPNNHEDITYDCEKKLKNIIMGNETPILKKIYIEINKCPSWMQEDLYQKREKEQLQEKNKTSFIKKLIKHMK